MQTLHSQGSGYCWVRNDIFVSKIKGTLAASHTYSHTFFVVVVASIAKEAKQMIWFI